VTTVTPPGAEKPEPGEIQVPEVTVPEVLAELRNGRPPFLLDIREVTERQQGHIADNLHIPMNSLPYRLNELDRAADIVVYCAHGNRSYSVTGWLRRQGFRARSLKGGFVDWQLRGGPVERTG
jgi:rhodanese-related sulfurtransferase